MSRILVYTRTLGYRHESIPAGVAALRSAGFTVDATEDPGAFTAERLRGYRVVVFLSTSGEVLDEPGRAAFEGYVRGGGGFVGVHAAAATLYEWPFYGGLVGAYFAGHPPVGPGTVTVEDRTHPATAHLAAVWERTDEWYEFRTDPRPRVRVLLSHDGRPHAWCHANEGGRAFYTAGGHTVEAYAEPAFVAHLAGGIRYAAGED